MQEIRAKVVDEHLWREFHPKTEMIVTRKGRSMFPKLEYQITGLDPKSYYTFEIRMERVDQKRYKYDDGEWRQTGNGEPGIREHIVQHLDGARLGEHWMSTTIGFPTLKLTNNNTVIQANHVILRTMCKYRPVLKVIERSSAGLIIPSQNYFQEEFRFNFTEFIAVTSYQNKDIIRLKVQHNKYASAFRAEANRKRSRTESGQYEDENSKRAAKIRPCNYPQPMCDIPKPLTPPEEPGDSQDAHILPPAPQSFEPFIPFHSDYPYSPYNFTPYPYYPQPYYNGFIHMSNDYAPNVQQFPGETSVALSPDSSCSY